MDDVRTVFRKFDQDGDGVITREELKGALHLLDPTWTDDIIDALLACMDASGDGLVQYEEFVEWVFKETPSFFDVCGENTSNAADKVQAAMRSCALNFSSIGVAMDDLGIDINLDGAEPDLTDVVTSLQSLNSKQLRDVFQAADVGKKGHLRLGEIQSLLYPQGKAAAGANAVTVAKVFAQMDKSKDGKVTCGEFISYLIARKKGLSTAPTDADKRHIATAFNEADRNSDGNITVEELERLLSCTTEEEKQLVRRCFEAADKNSDGKLSIVEFSRIYGKELVQEAKGIEVEWKQVPDEPESEED
jgi:Ca2+-binding EF-hand superfamily protein